MKCRPSDLADSAVLSSGAFVMRDSVSQPDTVDAAEGVNSGIRCAVEWSPGRFRRNPLHCNRVRISRSLGSPMPDEGLPRWLLRRAWLRWVIEVQEVGGAVRGPGDSGRGFKEVGPHLVACGYAPP